MKAYDESYAEQIMYGVITLGDIFERKTRV